MADDKKVNPIVEHREVNPLTREYMHLVEERNKARVALMVKTRRRQNAVGLFLTCIVAGIYSYTITSVKQEKFLDDFEEPKLIEKN